VLGRAGLSFVELQAFDLSGWTLRWGMIATSCAALLGGYFTTGFLWGMIVHGLGGPSLPPAVRVRLFMIANLGRYVPGKVWQIAGLVALSRKWGIPAQTATAAAILGQGLALLSALFIGLGSVWTLADGASWKWVVPVCLISGIAFGLFPPVFSAVTRAWFRVAGTPEPEGLAPSDAIRWLTVAFLNWCAYSLAFGMLVSGLGLQAPILSAASAFAAAYVLGYVAVFAPAGLGVREATLTLLLTPHFGVTTAGAVAVTARLWTTVIEVIPAAVFWVRHLTSEGEAQSGE
jgi:hypothetical protein